MSYQINRVIAYMISNLIGVGVYAVLLSRSLQGGSLAESVIDSAYGRMILTVIGIQIALSIVLIIIVSIVQAVVTRDEDFDSGDERDNLIDLRANRISFSVFGVGYLLAMIALALGQPVAITLNMIVLSLFGAAIVGYVAQLFYYRRGF
jgi:uncharacterized membrane protein